jgi:hypothetical protein
MLSTADIDVIHWKKWFSPGTPVSSTNKTNHHNIAKILLKVALSTITLTLKEKQFDMNTKLWVKVLWFNIVMGVQLTYTVSQC